MIIAIILRGFSDLRRSVTPIQFSFDGSFSLPIFYVLRKNKKKYIESSLIFLQNAPSNSVHLPVSSSFSCAVVLNASLRVKVCENDGNI